MCGIVAIAGFTPEEVLVAMRETLQHRGPDAAGVNWWPEAGLAHRRLSIIDLDGGKQPLSNEDGSVWVTYNGEIYNYLELRKELEAAGHRFATRSDTEVIVHLYEDIGERCVERLRGDFAFAIWDRRRGEMFAARDRLGVKPLYYTRAGDTLLIASEIKALLKHPAVSREIDVVSLDQYLSYLYIPSPRTIFQGIYQLPPAHRLSFSDGSLQTNRYWQPPLHRDDAPTRIEEVVEEVRETLDDAVRVRMMSEVPLGAFLSGGIDSSSLVAAMAKSSNRAIRTFTIRFPAANSLYDEGPAANCVSKHLHTDHVELEAKADCTDYLLEMVHGFDQPFGNPTSLLVYVLSKLTREHVTVAMAGDGGDELFGGYPRYQGLRCLKRYGLAPRFVRKAVAAIAQRVLRDRLDGNHTRRRIREFLQSGDRDIWDGYLGWIGYWDGYEKDRIYTSEFQNRVGKIDHGEWLADRIEESASADLLASASALDLVSFLPENLLAYSDRMSMAHSLEIRVPFTDHLLIERVLPLKTALKWPNGQLKGALRASAAERLPAEILTGKKIGFNPPMASWLCGQMSGVLKEYLSEECVRRRGIFRPETINMLKAQLNSGSRDISLQIWALVVLECWMREYLD